MAFLLEKIEFAKNSQIPESGILDDLEPGLNLPIGHRTGEDRQFEHSELPLVEFLQHGLGQTFRGGGGCLDPAEVIVRTREGKDEAAQGRLLIFSSISKTTI